MAHSLFLASANNALFQVASIPFPPPGKFSLPTSVTTMTFDAKQELLWTGNEFVGPGALVAHLEPPR